jgi:hypothetical protein
VGGRPPDALGRSQPHLLPQGEPGQLLMKAIAFSGQSPAQALAEAFYRGELFDVPDAASTTWVSDLALRCAKSCFAATGPAWDEHAWLSANHVGPSALEDSVSRAAGGRFGSDLGFCLLRKRRARSRACWKPCGGAARE